MPTIADTPAGKRNAFAHLGALLLDAGYAVTDVHMALSKVAEKTGHPEMTFAILPQTVMVSDEPSGAATVVNATGAELPFRTTARVSALVRKLATGKVPVSGFSKHIQTIRDEAVAPGLWAVSLGSGLLSAGLGMLFRIPWWSVITAAILGVIIGLVIYGAGRVRGAGTIITFVIAFCSTFAVGLLASTLDLGPIPLFAVCAPLAVLVPGATITNGLLELSSTDMVTGSSRLMYGVLVLGFMTTGIGAAARVTGLTINSHGATLLGDVHGLGALGERRGLADFDGLGMLGGLSALERLPPLWVSWIGVVGVAMGISLAFGAGRMLTLLSIPAMMLTYAGITMLSPWIGSIGAAGVVACVFFFLARGLEWRVPRAPAIVTFRPAFLLLVPGVVGLVALTTFDDAALITALGTFLSLSIGTKTGAVLADLVFRHEAVMQDEIGLRV